MIRSSVGARLAGGGDRHEDRHRRGAGAPAQDDCVTALRIGGITNRGAPTYGEDTRTILKELLEMSDEEVDRLAAEDVI